MTTRQISRLAQRRRRVFFWLAAGYALLLVVVCVTRLNLVFFLLGQPMMRQEGLNLIPLHSILTGLRRAGRLTWDTFGNFVMFLPVGIVLCYVQKKPAAGLACVQACALSLCIEGAQFLLKTGAVDIDDVLLNTLGGAVGVLLWAVLSRVCAAVRQDVHDVAAQYVTMFPPYLLFYIQQTFFSMSAYRYRFVWWHAVPFTVYFAVVYALLLRDLPRRQTLVYGAAVLTFSVYYFGFFL